MYIMFVHSSDVGTGGEAGACTFKFVVNEKESRTQDKLMQSSEESIKD